MRYIRAYSGRFRLNWEDQIVPYNVHIFLKRILPDNPFRSNNLDELVTDLYNFSVYGGIKPPGSYETMRVLMYHQGFIKETRVKENVTLFRENRNKK